MNAQIRKRLLAVSAGKANYELQQLTKAKGKTKVHLLVHVTTREEIEKCDMRRFVHDFRPTLELQRLVDLQRKVLFTVHGYDEVDEPLFAIPSVRKYYAKCHEVWPCWSYFSELRSDCLAVIAACVTPNLSIVRHRRRKKVEVAQTQAELIEFFEYGLSVAALLHHKASIGKQQGMMLLRDVSYYLRLPESFGK